MTIQSKYLPNQKNNQMLTGPKDIVQMVELKKHLKEFENKLHSSNDGYKTKFFYI